MTFLRLLPLLLLVACHRDPPPASPVAPAPAATAPAASAPAAVSAAPVSAARWFGAVAPAAQWPATTATDVLVRAAAPGLDPSAVDVTLRPVAARLRALPGVERVVARARAGEARLLVRMTAAGPQGLSASTAVLSAWRSHPPAGLADPQVEPIVRGERALAALEGVATGGRPEATAYADAHVDALLHGTHQVTRTHLAGAVRPYLALRLIPSALALNGVGLADVLTSLHQWLEAGDPQQKQPTVEITRHSLHPLALKRHWTANNQPLPAVALDTLLDISPEQGEPTREALTNQLPTTLWLLNGYGSQSVPEAESAARQVAQASAGKFRASLQSLANAYRLVLTVPENRPAETVEDLGKRLLQLRTSEESVVALNAIAGLDGVPEPLDLDGRQGRRWTLWVSIATADSGAVLNNVRDALAKGPGGWDVHVLDATSDTALCWVLDAWGSGGVLISGDDAAALGPIVGAIAERARTAREKAGTRQGPQPELPPIAWQRLEPRNLQDVGLPADMAAFLVESLDGPRPLGWWHDAPIWLGWPHGDLSATLGLAPLLWPKAANARGTGPGKSWVLADVLRQADPTPLVERVRVDGRPALWIAAEDYADLPGSVADSFWRLVEREVDLKANMRLDPLNLAQKALAIEPSPSGLQNGGVQP